MSEILASITVAVVVVVVVAAAAATNFLFTHIYSHLSSPAAPAKSQGEGRLFKTLSVDNAATRTRADWPTPASGRARASRMRAN